MAAPSSRPDNRRRYGLRLIALAALLALSAHGADRARAAWDRWIASTPLPVLTVPVGTEVVARDGTLLRAFPVGDGLWRLAPPQEGVDPRFLSMLIAWEDRRFYDHDGIDRRAVLRAGWQAVTHGRIVSGASTLSMQTARLLERGKTGDWQAKLRQARVALALERHLGKQRILDLYLRLAPYGGNTEGVRAASLMWFGKEPRRLTPAEAALLVALPQSPESRRPDLPRARDAAKAARDRVIDHALSLGLINAEAAGTARATPLPEIRRSFPAHAALLADQLRRENPGSPRIETTIDAQLQKAAERLAARAVEGQADQVSAAILLADHGNGEILAQVGTAQFADGASGGFVDMTRALRSPGSTLKPFVYALGFDEGLIHPETLIEDRPAAFGRWQPQNFDNRFRGTVTIRQALQESLNLPVVRVAEVLGSARVMAAFRRAEMKVTVRGDAPGLAVVLGGAGVSLVDLVQGYATLARGGRSVRLHDRSGVPDEPGALAFGPVAAWQAANMLAGIPPPGGRAAGRVAFKTGTSYGHRDALAVGFDGRFVAGVWMGRPDGTPVPGAFGGDYAAPVLFDLFDVLGSRSVPLPLPPEAALTGSNATLPRPLRRFLPPGALPDLDTTLRMPEPLTIQFPPDSAEVELDGPTLMVRARGGTPPYSWLLNGAAVAVGASGPVAELATPTGFSSLTVIDGRGHSARVEFRASGGG